MIDLLQNTAAVVWNNTRCYRLLSTVSCPPVAVRGAVSGRVAAATPVRLACASRSLGRLALVALTCLPAAASFSISKQLHSPDSSPVSHGEDSPLGDGIINGRRVSERAWREYLARGCDLWATAMDEPDSPELL